MRVVIDLQVCQGRGLQCDASLSVLAFASALVRQQAAHEVIIALNGSAVETVDAIRARFPALPPQCVKVWSAPTPGHPAAPLLREAYMAALEPDWVLQPLLLDADDAIIGRNQFYGLPTVHLLLGPASSPGWHDRLDDARCADLILTPSPQAGAQAVDRLGFEPERVITLPEWAGFDDGQAMDEAAWDRVARYAWSGLAQFHQGRPPLSMPQDRGGRPRLAYVVPQPVHQDGVPGPVADLVPELARWYEVDVVVKAPEMVGDRLDRAHCGLVSIDQFWRSAPSYDRVVYNFANVDACDPLFDLLRDIPGVVVLRDFSLAGAQEYSERQGRRPHCRTRALMRAHGYKAVAERDQAVPSYPANLPVLQDALGIIASDHHTLGLADDWYGEGTSRDWAVVAPPHAPEKPPRRNSARDALGMDPDALIVCAFDVPGGTTLSPLLLDAWLESPISKADNAYLVFAGPLAPERSAHLRRRLRRDPRGPRVLVCGHITSDDYRTWLAAADVAVQLQETASGDGIDAILDCLGFGLATVVNAIGGVAELDDGAVRMLPADVGPAQLAEVLTALSVDAAGRVALGSAAMRFVRDRYHPRHCAKQYAHVVEQIYARLHRGGHGVPGKLSGLRLTGDELADAARAFNRNHPPTPRPRQLLVDVSELVRHDAGAGIQRVARAVLSEWLRDPPAGYVVEPVYATADKPGFRYARRYTAASLDISGAWMEDDAVEAWDGDVFVAVDLQPVVIPAQAPTLHDWRNRGVRVAFVVHDVLPLLLPHRFPPETYGAFLNWLTTVAQFDALIGVSKTVAADILNWLETVNPERSRPVAVGWYHNGADIARSWPSQGLPAQAQAVLEQLRAHPSFLMVGTLEPRKGHAQTLAAFEQLWRKGLEANLVIVGKQGWMNEDVVNRLRHHPLANSRLFFLEKISDEYLEQVYEASACLIAASEGEGFGLPLIEAAHHRLPILARDLAVFREVAGGHASYFPDDPDPATIAAAVRRWLEAYGQGRHVRADDLSHQTWQESARQLWDAIRDRSRSVDWSMRSRDDHVFWGSDRRLNTSCGSRHGRDIVTTNTRGFLFFGPYLPLRPGTYRLTVRGHAGHMTGEEFLDISGKAGSRTLVRYDVGDLLPLADPMEIGGLVTVDEPIADFEIRFFVVEETVCTVSEIRMEWLADSPSGS